MVAVDASNPEVAGSIPKPDEILILQIKDGSVIVIRTFKEKKLSFAMLLGVNKGFNGHYVGTSS